MAKLKIGYNTLLLYIKLEMPLFYFGIKDLYPYNGQILPIYNIRFFLLQTPIISEFSCGLPLCSSSLCLCEVMSLNVTWLNFHIFACLTSYNILFLFFTREVFFFFYEVETTEKRPMPERLSVKPGFLKHLRRCASGKHLSLPSFCPSLWILIVLLTTSYHWSRTNPSVERGRLGKRD